MNTTSPVSNPSGAWELSFQAGLGVLVVLAISILAYYALAKLRGLNNEDSASTDLLQKNFEEMRSEGDISEAEFRKIRATLESVAPPQSPAQTSPAQNRVPNTSQEN